MNDAATGAPRAHRAPRIGVVLKGWPRLSETFIAHELAALERRGLALALYSLRQPTDAATHPVHGEVAAPVTYLPEYLHDAPSRVLRAWRAARRLPGYRAALAAFRADLARDRTRNRVRRFGQALVLAAELPADVGWLHAHFLHTPASVTRYAAALRGLPWSVSAHAKDIWTTPDWEKRRKLASCAWAVTCTRANALHLRALAPDPAQVDLVYHGLDAARFPPPPATAPRAPGAPVVVLAVGRAVEKKGFDDLLAALAQLPGALSWRFEHVGGGPLLPALAAQARALGIDGRVAWRGALPQPAVLERYRAADVFALPSRIAADGDRDGLPNVLMEAQSQRLPCVATTVSGIPELIDDGRTGLLVPPRDVPALSRALAALIGDAALRERIGAAGCERTRREFAFERGIDRLVERFGARVAA
ncbi:MAG: colanic acid biosynthesis glycosyltransferase WcaL [Betaproteobacteria bacterium]|nr:MAG: colanic acid biosynthesis glycosyltransferase WcaL [Betaproteobacteria bacterium]